MRKECRNCGSYDPTVPGCRTVGEFRLPDESCEMFKAAVPQAEKPHEPPIDLQELRNRREGNVTFQMLHEALAAHLQNGNVVNAIVIVETKEEDGTHIFTGWNHGMNGFEAVGLLEIAKQQEIMKFKGLV